MTHLINKIEVVNNIPNGWKILEGATTAPKGYKWIYNNKSLFSKKRKKALLKIKGE